MRSKRLLIFLLATFANFYAAAAQVADSAGVLRVTAGSTRSRMKLPAT